MGNYFVKNLKYLREKKHISQGKLAELAKVNQTTIMRWEQGTMSPSVDNIDDLANVLNVQVADLLGKDLENDDEYDELNEVLFSKAKDLSEEDKKMVIGIINAIKRDVDKEEK